MGSVSSEGTVGEQVVFLIFQGLLPAHSCNVMRQDTLLLSLNSF